MRSFGGATLLKVDPQTGTFTTLPLPYGVQSLTTGAGAVWIRERQKRQVLRLDVADGTRRGFVVGNGPSGIAFGAGKVWVANRDDGSVTRIDAGLVQHRGHPGRHAAGGHRRRRGRRLGRQPARLHGDADRPRDRAAGPLADRAAGERDEPVRGRGRWCLRLGHEPGQRRGDADPGAYDPLTLLYRFA